LEPIGSAPSAGLMGVIRRLRAANYRARSRWLCGSAITAAPRRGDGLAQAADRVDQHCLPALQQVDREEEASARDECAAIIGHPGERSTFALSLAEVEAADYAHRVRAARGPDKLQSALRADGTAGQPPAPEITVRPGTYASCQERPRVVPQTGGVLAKLDSARYRQLQHQELGRRPAPTCSPSKVAFFLRKKMWPVRQLNGTSHHGVMRSSLRRRGRE
jgi:hypothetical protein